MARRSSEAAPCALPEPGGGRPLPETEPLTHGLAEPEFARAKYLGWPLTLQLLGGSLWIGLATWKLSTVPGMSMDEAWAIISARGQWPPANPLSGMSSYSGPFPGLLLKLFGTNSGLLVLRGASALANGTMLVLLALMLRRRYPERALVGWAVPLIATCPVSLITLRTGIEVTMFTPFLTVLGFFLFTRGAGWWVFAAGVSWGLLVYNHLIGAWVLMSIGMAWLVVYQRWLPPGWKPALAGFCVGLLPRLVAMTLYENEQITGFANAHSPKVAFADLRWLPQAFWDTLNGRTVYLRYVGRIAVEIWPYWLVAPLVLLPWVRHLRAVPRHAWFILVAIVSFCALTTVGAPYLAVRFFVLPALGLSVVVVLLGAAAIELDRRWAHLVRATAGALLMGNLYYLLNNFYLPWHRHEFGVTGFFLGERSPRTGSWHFLPKDKVADALRQLSPAPEQVISNHSLNRPLRALLNDTGIRAVTWDDADSTLRSVYVDYSSWNSHARYCGRTPGGRMCFGQPLIVDKHFVLYRSR